MSHGYSPADVLRSALIQGGVGVLPSGTTPPRVPTWPVYAGHLPDAPDNAMCCYDTAGKKDGRVMAGETITHPGWQIRIRTMDARTGWVKAREVQRFLDGIKNLSISINGDAYEIKAVTQTGTPLALGPEPDKTRRESITINGTMTLKELQP